MATLRERKAKVEEFLDNMEIQDRLGSFSNAVEFNYPEELNF